MLGWGLCGLTPFPLSFSISLYIILFFKAASYASLDTAVSVYTVCGWACWASNCILFRFISLEFVLY